MRWYEGDRELALLAHDQLGTYRSVLMPTAVTNASDYLPKDWKSDEVPPFDACLRAVPAYEHGPTLEDFGRLAGFCRLTAVFTGPRRSGGAGHARAARGGLSRGRRPRADGAARGQLYGAGGSAGEHTVADLLT